MIIVQPGTVLPWVRLVDVLREQHEDAVAARVKEIAERKTNSAPLDDETRWPEVERIYAEAGAHVARRATSAVEDAARALLRAVAGNEIAPLLPLDLPDDLDDVEVRLRVLSDADRRSMLGDVIEALMRLSAAHREGKGNDELRELDALAARAQDAYVLATIAEVRGVSVLDPDGAPAAPASVADLLPGLRLAGVVSWLLSAGRYAQELPAGKAVRCGRRQRSISPTSSAPSATPQRANSEDATAGLVDTMAARSGLQVRPEKQTPARAGSYSPSLESPTLSPSLAPWEIDSAPRDNG